MAKKVWELGYYKERYGNLFENLKKACFNTEPKKVAFSLTIGVCIGVIPLLGVTLIAITSIGLLFKLNQIIIQTTHLLISPLQILLIPVFLKTGQVLFLHSSVNTTILSYEIAHGNFVAIFQQFGKIMFYGLMVWLAFSIIVGLIMYKVTLVFLRPKSNKNLLIP